MNCKGALTAVILVAVFHTTYYTSYVAIYTAFLMYFSDNLFYIPKAVRLIREEHERCKEEGKIDSEIFER